MDYSDKRDIGTLEYQMTTMCQDQRTITEFYQAVYQYLSLILDNIACLDLDESSLFAMPRSYRDKALNTFVRGLKRDLPMLLSSKETASLSQALHICLKLDNTSYRMTMLMDKLQGQIKKFEVAEIKQSIQTFIQRKVTLDSRIDNYCLHGFLPNPYIRHLMVKINLEITLHKIHDTKITFITNSHVSLEAIFHHIPDSKIT